MAVVAPTQGNREMLRRMIRQVVLGDSLIIRLFRNKASGIAKSDSVRSFLYPVGTGYAQQTLNPASWTYPSSGGDTIFYPTVSFVFTSGDSINGYVINTTKQPGDSVVLWAEVFSSGAYVVPGGGGTVRVTPQIGIN